MSDDEAEGDVWFRPVRRVRGGLYKLRLSDEERDLLRDLPNQMKDLLGQSEEPALRRLFPPAYIDDAEGEQEYRRLVGEDLLAGRQAALDTMAATIDATELDEEQLTAWLSSLNDLRLVIGTQLDVSEDEPHMDTPIHHVYYYLSALEEAVVSALASQYD